MQFFYPTREQKFQKINDLNHLKTLLSQQADLKYVGLQYFKISMHRKKRIYAICSKCSEQRNRARLYFVRDGDNFRLSRFQNNHQHPVDNKIAILEYMKKLPSSIESLSERQIVKQTFGITNSQFYYLKRKKIKSQFKAFTLVDLKLFLQKNDCFYSCGKIDQRGFPQYIFASNKSMKELYKRNGFTMRTDFTFNLFTDQFQNQSYTLGLTSGFNNRNKILVYSICVTPGEKKEYIKRFLQWTQLPCIIFV